MARTRILENGKRREEGGKKKADELLDEEIHKAIQRELALLKKQLTLEPILDNTEKQVRLVNAILRMNISALRGTIVHDSSPSLATARKQAVDRLVQITNAFDKKKHTAETINEDARAALNELSETFQVFGPSWISIRDSIVQLALEQIEDIKGKDPLHVEKAELEKLERRERERREKEEKEKKERERLEREKKKKKKKNKKNAAPAAVDEPILDDFGEDRVPPQTTMCEHSGCTCQHRADSDDYDRSTPDAQPPPSVCLSYIPSDPSRSRSSSTSTTSSTNPRLPVLSQMMSLEYWSQFCYFYDNGSK